MTLPPRPWRLAVFCDRFPELSETFVAGEVRELRRRGIAVTVYAGPPNRRDVSWDEEVPLQPLETDLQPRVRGATPVVRMALAHPAAVARDVRDRGRWRRHEHVAALRRLASAVERLHRERTQHIHVHFAAEASLAALRLSRLTGIPFSITAHAYELFLRPANLREKFGEAAFVTVPCAYNVTELAKSGLAGERMHVRMLGTDTRSFQRVTPLPEDGLTLAVGRLIEKKGFHMLIEAAARRDLGRVCIVGDGPWRTMLEDLIAARGVQERVTLAGVSTPADVKGWMEKASMLVVPSVVATDGDQDAMPVVLWEALAMELPVVGTAVAGIPEVARPPWGRVVAPGDPDALADAIVAWQAAPTRIALRRAERGARGSSATTRRSGPLSSCWTSSRQATRRAATAEPWPPRLSASRRDERHLIRECRPDVARRVDRSSRRT